jgi:catechol 2,3-dioxygenase-like lactoylglutathione lyase family enzyme
MAISLDHTIVHATDKHASATFLANILGLEAAPPWGPFVPLLIPNGVTLDFLETSVVHKQHYAFLVDDAEFEPIFERIQRAGAHYYADPHGTRPGQINYRFGGRGVYFDDPDGHIMEVLTRPNGDTGASS